MPPTDLADLLDRMAELLADARPAPSRDPADGFCPPMEALNAPARSFAAVYGPETRLLVQLSDAAAAAGDDALSRLLTRLDQALRNGDLDLPADPTPAPRLGRFVYPVV